MSESNRNRAVLKINPDGSYECILSPIGECTVAGNLITPAAAQRAIAEFNARPRVLGELGQDDVRRRQSDFGRDAYGTIDLRNTSHEIVNLREERLEDGRLAIMGTVRPEGPMGDKLVELLKDDNVFFGMRALGNVKGSVRPNGEANESLPLMVITSIVTWDLCYRHPEPEAKCETQRLPEEVMKAFTEAAETLVDAEHTTRWENIYLALCEYGLRYTLSDGSDRKLTTGYGSDDKYEVFDNKDQVWIESFDVQNLVLTVCTKDDWRATWPERYPEIADGDVYRVTIKLEA